MIRRPIRRCDALIIGGGFYGAEVALELKRLGFGSVVLVERESSILRRASFVNQARVHNGYHYPRSSATAERSRANFDAFLAEYAYAIHLGMESIYAIARYSQVSASQFEAFCRAIRAPCHPASQRIAALFDSNLIEEAFLTREFAFDATRLAAKLASQLAAANVEVCLGSSAHIVGASEDGVDVQVDDVIHAAYVFNCTYSAIEFVGVPIAARVKKELTEIVLIKPPPALDGIGVTVMDGPFFSTMPFPAAQLYSLSHVRYTPHESSNSSSREPLAPKRSNRKAMIRDAQRYLPCLAGARIAGSIFEIKATLIRNEQDDGRPILIERAALTPRVLSILGSKIDNIYDVRTFLRSQDWSGLA